MRVLALVSGPGASARVRSAQGVPTRMGPLSRPAAGLDLTTGPTGRLLLANKPMVSGTSFAVPFGMGVIDARRAARLDLVSAFGRVFALLAFCCAASYLWFLRRADATDRPKPLSNR